MSKTLNSTKQKKEIKEPKIITKVHNTVNISYDILKLISTF